VFSDKVFVPLDITLTWWRGVDGVKFVTMFRYVLQGVVFHKVERIPWLWTIVHSDDLIESSAVITHRRSTGPAE